MKFISLFLFLLLSFRTFAADSSLFEGIVDMGNCSGSLVKFNGAPSTQKALVMTNGHCMDGLNVGEVWLNKVENREVILFNHQLKKFKVETQRIIYSTMVDTDVTFYELRMSYQEIEDKYKIEAFIIDDVPVSPGTEITVISGYWTETTSCKAEAIVPVLKEADWVWKDAIRYSKECMTRGGFSGSAVIANNTRTIVGIHNTGNNGKLDCSKMNPCEQDRRGRLIFREPNRRYAQQVHQFYGCLGQDYGFDFSLPTCTVAKGR